MTAGLAVDAVGDTDQHVLDLPRAEIAVETPQGSLVAERGVARVEPESGFFPAPQDFLCESRDPSEPQQAVGLVGVQPPLLLAACQGAWGKVQDLSEVFRGDGIEIGRASC